MFLMSDWLQIVSIRHKLTKYIYVYEVNTRTGTWRTNRKSENDEGRPDWIRLDVWETKKWIRWDFFYVRF